MRLLVLGRNGQVGWALERSLAILGEVFSVGRDSADLGNPAQLRDVVLRVSPDVILNAGAYTAVDRAESDPENADRINHRAVAELSEMSARRGNWLVHFSTDYVYDGSKKTPYLETDAESPTSVYGKSKLDGERALSFSGAKHLIFRTSWVHASRGKNFIRTILKLAADREQLRVVADQFGSPTSAELIADVTAAAVAAIGRGTAPAVGTYHLTAAGDTTWFGLAQFAIGEAVRLGASLKASPLTVEPIASEEFPTPAVRPRNSRMDTSKLRHALGITLPPWQLHVRRTVSELLENRL